MSKQELKLYMERQRLLYKSVKSFRRRSLFIDKVVEATGYDRKRAIRLLNRKTETYAPRGAHRKLRDEDVELIRKIWANCGYPNALYLKHMLPRFLKDSIEQGEHIGASQMKRALRVSYKTLERELSPYRVRLDSQESTALKAAIKAKVNLVAPLREVTEPGHICLDTVSHGGRSGAGNFVWTLTWTDIYTGFTLNRAVWNKGYTGMAEAFDFCLANTPFPIKSINTDNGSEFLNYHALRYWEDKPVELTRSRPYHKNDNAHAEQKNRTHVRELFLRVRLAREGYVPLMNRIYEVSNTIRNFFVPCKVLKGREYIPGKHRSRRIYDKEQTPYQRIIGSGIATTIPIYELKERERSYNCAKIFEEQKHMLEEFFTLVSQDPESNS